MKSWDHIGDELINELFVLIKNVLIRLASCFVLVLKGKETTTELATKLFQKLNDLAYQSLVSIVLGSDLCE